MSRKQHLIRTAPWLAFLATALILPLVYLPNAPLPVGKGLLAVMGSGALVGAALGAAAYLPSRRLLEPGERRWRLMPVFVALTGGALGGAAGAALLDGARVVQRRAVELPIVRIESLPSRRHYPIQIATLSPLDPTGQDHVPVNAADGGQLREGDCLKGVVERGWLGGLWAGRYRAGPCSPSRGAPGPRVIVPDGGFADWRWHRPRGYRIGARGEAWDEALPAALTCRLRPDRWLYRCSRDRRTDRTVMAKSPGE